MQVLLDWTGDDGRYGVVWCGIIYVTSREDKRQSSAAGASPLDTGLKIVAE